MALLKNVESLLPPGQLLPNSTARPKFREIKSLLTWVPCFATYIAIISEKHSQMVRPLLAYLCLIIREAQRNGGDGWAIYDKIFRQNAQGDSSVDWSKLDSSLHSSTFLAFQSGPGTFCPLCFDCDHSQIECALFPLSPVGPQPPPNQLMPVPWPIPKPPVGRRPDIPPICVSWNKGRCFRAPAPCNYRHICILCGRENHPARDCRLAPPESFFGRAAPKSAKTPRLSDAR